MSGQSEVILKKRLRRLEYPLCAEEALKEITKLVGSTTDPDIRSINLSRILMAEFVFREVDSKGNKRPANTSATVELYLVHLILSILTNNHHETGRFLVFQNFFTAATITARQGVLSKLVLLAVGIPCANVLLAISTWMQQLGTMTPLSCKLAKEIVFDYFHLSPNPEDRLKDLGGIAPEFTANFLTSVAENYFIVESYPPDALVKCITNWLTENSTLCIAAQQRKSVISLGTFATLIINPVAGLLRWCVLAPIQQQNEEIYVNLFEALVNNILHIPKSGIDRTVSVTHLIRIIRRVSNYHAALKKVKGNEIEQIRNEPRLELALNRLAQGIQLALSVDCIHGYRDELIDGLDEFRFNTLVRVVVNKYKDEQMIADEYFSVLRGPGDGRSDI